MDQITVDPLSLISPKRSIRGAAAVLLPYQTSGEVDWRSFQGLLERTLEAGLIPAVNMDTGYVNLLDEHTKRRVLQEAQAIVGGGRYFAGAFVPDSPGDSFNESAYAERTGLIQERGGVPVIFQSYGLAHVEGSEVIDNYRTLASHCDEFIAFELGTMFAPFGKIYGEEVFRELLKISQCSGAKHSSLCRETEWSRITMRNEARPEFRVYTGNDLAIDMVIYGSDYLLGLAAFAPDLFAKRDACWAAGDSRWNTINDYLQHIGMVAFRAPVPAYKHSVAIYLHHRGWLPSSETHPDSPRRSEADEEMLRQLAAKADSLFKEEVG